MGLVKTIMLDQPYFFVDRVIRLWVKRIQKILYNWILARYLVTVFSVNQGERGSGWHKIMV